MPTHIPHRLACLLPALIALNACCSTPPSNTAFLYHPHIARPGIPFLYSEDFKDVLDQKISANGGGVELTDKQDKKHAITSLRDWCQAMDDGWYPYTTYDRANHSFFLHAYQTAAYFSLAKPSRISFVQAGFTGITLNDVPANLCQDMGDPTPGIDHSQLAPMFPKAVFVSEKTDAGNLSIDFPDTEYGGRSAQCELTILAWGDFNGDGIEDLLVSEYFCPGGSLRCYGTSIFTRTSADAPLARVQVNLPHWKTLDKKED